MKKLVSILGIVVASRPPGLNLRGEDYRQLETLRIEISGTNVVWPAWKTVVPERNTMSQCVSKTKKLNKSFPLSFFLCLFF